MTTENDDDFEKKLVLFVGLPLIVLAGGYWLYRRFTSGNDSPIIVTDTSSGYRGQKTSGYFQTTVWHGKGFGKNAKNHFTAHDKDNDGSDNYLPACLVFPSTKPATKVSLAGAQTWQVNYTDSNGSSGTLMTWVADGDVYNDAGDITMGDAFRSTSNTTITKAVKVVDMSWSINGGSFSAPIKADDKKELFTVHYCPGGACTQTGKNPCA